METLEEIRQGKLEPGDLPPIQVIIGTDEKNHHDGGEPWYFSLNNRRLWVLKQCHREGLLDNERYNNKIGVRARAARSQGEISRYTVANCALEAKFMREDGGNKGLGQKKKEKKKKGKEHKREEENDALDRTADDHGDVCRHGSEKDEEIILCDTIENKDMMCCDNEAGGSDDGNYSDEDDSDFAHRTNPFSALS